MPAGSLHLHCRINNNNKEACLCLRLVPGTKSAPDRVAMNHLPPLFLRRRPSLSDRQYCLGRWARLFCPYQVIDPSAPFSASEDCSSFQFVCADAYKDHTRFAGNRGLCHAYAQLVRVRHDKLLFKGKRSLAPHTS